MPVCTIIMLYNIPIISNMGNISWNPKMSERMLVAFDQLINNYILQIGKVVLYNMKSMMSSYPKCLSKMQYKILIKNINTNFAIFKYKIFYDLNQDLSL